MNTLWAWITGVAAVLAAVLGIRQSGVRRERERQEALRRREELEARRREAEKLDRLREKRDEVDRLPDDDVARRLRDKWTRD